LEHIAYTYPHIPLQAGIPQLLKNGVHPRDAFAFDSLAYNGKIEGTWSHTSVRNGKMDAYPDPRLVEILKRL
jgi:hypothetical protein